MHCMVWHAEREPKNMPYKVHGSDSDFDRNLWTIQPPQKLFFLACYKPPKIWLGASRFVDVAGCSPKVSKPNRHLFLSALPLSPFPFPTQLSDKNRANKVRPLWHRPTSTVSIKQLDHDIDTAHPQWHVPSSVHPCSTNPKAHPRSNH